MAEENNTETMNETHGCIGEFELGFNLLYVAVPLNAIIMCKTVLVILTVYRTPVLHTNANIMMTSLSISDVLLATSYISIGDYKMAIYQSFNETSRFIKTLVFGQWTSSVLISFGHMAIIAIDRYILIGHPFYYIKHMTKRRTHISLACVWIMGLFILFFPLCVYSHSHYTYCTILQPPLEYYFLCFSVYCSSCLIVLASYLKIAILAFTHKKATSARRLQYRNSSDDVYKIKRTAAFRSVKFFALMFGVFIVCTLPTAIVSGLATVYVISYYVYICVTYLVLLNSVISFVIYFSMNAPFSKALKKTCSDLLAFIRSRMGRE